MALGASFCRETKWVVENIPKKENPGRNEVNF